MKKISAIALLVAPVYYLGAAVLLSYFLKSAVAYSRKRIKEGVYMPGRYLDLQLFDHSLAFPVRLF